MDESFEIDQSPDVIVKAEKLFRQLTPLLGKLCPDGEIHHVGGTAIAGVPTKGDLDIQIRVPAHAIDRAADRLSEHYSRNNGGFNPPTGYSYEGKDTDPPVGIHLTVLESKADIQWVFTRMLNADAALRSRYAAIKSANAGKSMKDYRDAKASFFEELVELPEFHVIRNAEET